MKSKFDLLNFKHDGTFPDDTTVHLSVPLGDLRKLKEIVEQQSALAAKLNQMDVHKNLNKIYGKSQYTDILNDDVNKMYPHKPFPIKYRN